MLGDSDVAVDTRDLLIDVVEEFPILDGWWEALHDMEDFDLKPRAWRHIVVVICSVFLDVLKNLNELGKKDFETFWARNFD